MKHEIIKGHYAFTSHLGVDLCGTSSEIEPIRIGKIDRLRNIAAIVEAAVMALRRSDHKSARVCATLYTSIPKLAITRVSIIVVFAASSSVDEVLCSRLRS